MEREYAYKMLNQRELEMWIDNDEGLYNWWRGSRQSKRKFIQENRSELKELIANQLCKPPQEKTWRDYR